MTDKIDPKAFDDGGPAFPGESQAVFIPADIPDEWRKKIASVPFYNPGLTKREWFAGMAMTALMLSRTGTDKGLPENGYFTSTEEFVTKCYEIADAMLAEGKKK